MGGVGIHEVDGGILEVGRGKNTSTVGEKLYSYS